MGIGAGGTFPLNSGSPGRGLLGLDPQKAQMLSQALLGFSGGMMQGSDWRQGLAGGFSGAAQGMQQARQQYSEDEMNKLRRKLLALQEQQTENQVASDAAYEAAASKLPMPKDVDPDVWSNLPAPEKVKLSAGIIEQSVKGQEDPTSAFGAWYQDYKSTHNNQNPTAAEINAYRQKTIRERK